METQRSLGSVIVGGSSSNTVTQHRPCSDLCWNEERLAQVKELGGTFKCQCTTTWACWKEHDRIVVVGGKK